MENTRALGYYIEYGKKDADTGGSLQKRRRGAAGFLQKNMRGKRGFTGSKG
jgi:hypothetical protein